MSSTSETGHVVNVAKFGEIIAEVTAMGTAFNPANALIILAALITKKSACELVLTEVGDNRSTFREAVNDREIAYKGMNKYATRIIGALKASGVSPELMKDAKGILNKIRGTRTTKVKETDPVNPDPNTISVAQLSYENKKAHLEALKGLVKTEAKYKPNETELKVIELEAYIARLSTLNASVTTELKQLQTSKDDRNEELYAPITGLSELTGIVKAYVKSVLGTSDPVYKRIAAVKIRKPTEK
jgi:hypothetical protein